MDNEVRFAMYHIKKFNCHIIEVKCKYNVLEKSE